MIRDLDLGEPDLRPDAYEPLLRRQLRERGEKHLGALWGLARVQRLALCPTGGREPSFRSPHRGLQGRPHADCWASTVPRFLCGSRTAARQLLRSRVRRVATSLLQRRFLAGITRPVRVGTTRRRAELLPTRL